MKTVKLNVGGKFFETTKQTLVNSSYFKCLLDEDTWNKLPDKDLPLIDRSSELFEHVLCYLRNPEYPYPWQHSGELDFYGVKYNKAQVMGEWDEMKSQVNCLFTHFKNKYGMCENTGCKNFKIYNLPYCNTCGEIICEDKLIIQHGDLVMYRHKIYYILIVEKRDRYGDDEIDYFLFKHKDDIGCHGRNDITVGLEDIKGPIRQVLKSTKNE